MARRRLLLTSLALVGSFTLAGCASDGDSLDATPGDDAATTEESTLGTEEDPIQLGVLGASDPYWTTFQDAVEAEGISLEIIDFTEYPQLNPALAAGDLDINQFQHIQYLADYNVASGDTLQPIGATAIYPLGLYSQEFTSVDEIPDGGVIAIPNDNVNQARALLLLQSAGLVALEDGGNAASTPDDVIADESRVEIETVDAALTARALPDVAGAVLNNDFLEPAGLEADNALAADDPADPSAQPYVNVFVTRDEDKDNEVLNQLVEIYQGNQEVLDGVLEQSGGTAEFATTQAAELQAALTETEDAIRNAE